jgi:endonuclease YncB( thermonuclease family)
MSVPDVSYTYPAELVRVIDGDTAVLRIDLGFHTSTTQHVRFMGYNAPELHGMNASKAQAAKVELENLLSGRRLIVKTSRGFLQTFSRYLGEVWVADQTGWSSVSQWMIGKGYNVSQGA